MTNDEFIFNFLGIKKEDLDLEEGVFNVVSQAFRSGYNLGKIDTELLCQKKIFELDEKHQQKVDYILEEMKKLNNNKKENNMIKYTKGDIKGVDFHFENCESIYVPQCCFDVFELVGDEFFTLEAVIFDRGIVSNLHDKNDSPLEKMAYGFDIVCLKLHLKNEDTKRVYLIWSDEDGQFNVYQKAKMLTYKGVQVSVKEDNLEFDLDEVLNMNTGTVVKAVNSGALYTIESKLNVKYLRDTYVTKEILYEKFTLVK